MKNSEMTKNIVLFQCYLESKQDKPEIKNVLNQYKKLFPNIIDKNRDIYYIYKNLIAQNKID